MSRFLLIDTDGETIVAVLSMLEADAQVNVGAGQSLVAIDPATDTGAVINDGALKYSSADGLVRIADETPHDAFADFEFAAVVEP